jgi:hypothetical protein
MERHAPGAETDIHTHNGASHEICPGDATTTTSGSRRPETHGKTRNPKRNHKTQNRGGDDYTPHPPTRTQQKKKFFPL